MHMIRIEKNFMKNRSTKQITSFFNRKQIGLFTKLQVDKILTKELHSKILIEPLIVN